MARSWANLIFFGAMKKNNQSIQAKENKE